MAKRPTLYKISTDVMDEIHREGLLKHDVYAKYTGPTNINYHGYDLIGTQENLVSWLEDYHGETIEYFKMYGEAIGSLYI